ncbi:MAG: hypothetical protein COA78_16550 [Blastopirellula sp.]|nr:MAG: hypothetical protein COA78_16550 [Blastopirellula sp.]
MAQSIKLADTVMTFVRKESSLQSRSVAGQITHWINIGRAIEKSSAFDYNHITSVLEAGMSPDELTPEEQEVWFTQFADKMTEPSESETAFFDKRRSLGRGVGLSESGELIYETEPASK